MSYSYLTNCVSAKGADIEEMVDQAVGVQYAEFENAIGADEILSMFGTDVPLENDWAVSFWKSVYLDQKVYYVVHSAIEYVFTEDSY